MEVLREKGYVQEVQFHMDYFRNHVNKNKNRFWLAAVSLIGVLIITGCTAHLGAEIRPKKMSVKLWRPRSTKVLLLLYLEEVPALSLTWWIKSDRRW